MEFDINTFAQFGGLGVFLFLSVKAVMKLYADMRDDSSRREEKLMDHLDRVADTLDRIDDRLENMECRVQTLEEHCKKVTE